jgi:poly-beta-1,6-N-acetyl-D-glucosamine synthase
MVYTIIFIFVLYFLFVTALIVGWRKQSAHRGKVAGRSRFISVIVPARNEEHNIGLILKDLKQQDYNHFEVIIIDDHSTDNTIKVAHSIIDDRFQIVEASQEGKKRALTQAISLAKGEIIVTTDADCRVDRSWLSSINKILQDNSAMLVGGVSIEANHTFFSQMQAIEFASLVGSGAASLSYGIPTMCNGANLIFRKDKFEEVGGYEGNFEVASGDDEFLMRKFWDRYPGTIHFLKEQKSVVSTQPSEDIRGFMNQRLRWASKWKFNSSLKTKTLAVFIFLAQFSFLLASIGLFSHHTYEVVVLLTLRAVLEFVFLFPVCRFLNTRFNFLAFLALQAIYPIYVITIAVLSTFAPHVWKGREYR